MKKLIETRVLELIKLAEHRYARTFYKPSIEFFDNSLLLGTYGVLTNKLRFNESLPKETLLKDVEHQVAHMLCAFLYPIASQKHGSEFQQILQDITLVPLKIAETIVATSIKRTKTRYIYYCANCSNTLELTKHKHDRYVSESCNCGAIFLFTGNTRKFK